MPPCVYIMASEPRGVLYIGATSNLVGRVWQHRNDVVESFTKRHGIHTLVWYQHAESLAAVYLHERKLKTWRRERKIRLIEATNPEWADLSPTLL
ncbi:GIY-YIG nuclease family protein [Nocardia wallacei]|uniref:GIY-YIG nuclease family protein n=1 Tax=Nocardia wallacei TaxID=480035 RepID=UPI002458EAD6|nr:GIY-YIG nuclease family protein [Nocardia wallacei]